VKLSREVYCYLLPILLFHILLLIAFVHVLFQARPVIKEIALYYHGQEVAEKTEIALNMWIPIAIGLVIIESVLSIIRIREVMWIGKSNS